MKNSLLLISFLTVFQYFASAQYECLIDSAYYYQNPTAVATNTPTMITHVIAYNNNNRPLEVYYFDANLDSAGYALNTYNTYGKQLTGLYQIYVAGSFVNSSLEVYTYLNDTIVQEYKYADVYDQPTDTWTFTYFKTYTFNDSNFPLLPTTIEEKGLTNGVQTYGNFSTNTYTNFGKINYNSYKTWNNSTSTYDYNSQRFYTYNANQQNDSLFIEMWYNNGWTPMSKHVYAYNANNLQIDNYNWQYQTGIGYVYSFRNLTYYNTQNQVDSLITLQHDGTQFNPYYRQLKFYNANHQLTLEMGYDMTSGQPINAYKYEYTYSAYGNLIKFINNYWDVATLSWITQVVQDTYSTCIDVTGLEDSEMSNLICYPNPFTNELTLKSDREEEVVVVDVKGQQVFETHVNPGNNTLSLGHLENGIYFLKSTTGVQRVVKH